MTSQLHAQAVLDRLAASGSPALTVHDGVVPASGLPPYVLVRFSVRSLGAAVRPDASNLVMQSLPVEVTARVYSVGDVTVPALAPRSTRALANRVSAALLDWTPSVAERSCTPLRHIDSADLSPDEATGRTYFEVVDVYRFTSHPA